MMSSDKEGKETTSVSVDSGRQLFPQYVRLDDSVRENSAFSQRFENLDVIRGVNRVVDGKILALPFEVNDRNSYCARR